jgi:glycine/D-amino acid oxidase-like deaminating enzyme
VTERTPGSFWLDLDPRPAGPPLEGVARAETIVVGAGVAGAFTALHLAEAGVSVVVLEGERTAHGATGRNAGFLLADGAETFARVAAEKGPETAVALRTVGLLTRDLVARVAQDEEFDLRFRGSLRLAEEEEERRDLAETARALGEPLRFLEAESLPDAYRGRGFSAGLVDPGDGEVNPVRLVRAVLRRAQAEGARLFESSPVLRLEETRLGVRALTAGGVAEGERAVVATNAWIPRLLPDGPAVRPVRGQMLAARASPVPAWDAPVYARGGADYWRRVPGGLLILGGMRRAGGEEEETFDAGPSARVQGRLDRLLASLLPPATRTEVVARWAGTMGFSPDGLPSAGLAPGFSKVHVVGGFTGHGMGWGPGLAALLAERLLGRGAGPPDAFSPSRESVQPRADPA